MTIHQENPPRIVFFGTPDLVIPILDALEQSGLAPALVVTGEDKPRERKLVLTPPAPKIWARERDIAVLQPATIDDACIDMVRAARPQIGVVVAYGKILPERLLAVPPLGMFNVHYSLLPKHRGATPVESAILAGDTETGVSIQKMVRALDAGPIVAEVRAQIGTNETAPELRTRLNAMAAPLLVRTIRDICAGSASYHEQDHEKATFTKRIRKEDGLIDPKGDAVLNYRKFLAYAGWPEIYFFVSGKRVIIKDAALENSLFTIRRVVPEGKKEMSFADFLRGHKHT